jgi:parallel beta-helix repeat protein
MQGVQVYRGSSAQLYTNIIQNNGSNGIFVDRNSQAEVSANTITGNNGDGIRAMRNAGLDTAPTRPVRRPSSTTTRTPGTNAGYGVRCTIDGFMDGVLGTLVGTLGGKTATEGCTDSVAP